MTTQLVHTSRSIVSPHSSPILPLLVLTSLPPERLVDAWQNTPTKWYPLPIAAGALLLVVLQYRKKSTSREVVVNEDGQEIVRLKGPWHVRPLLRPHRRACNAPSAGQPGTYKQHLILASGTCHRRATFEEHVACMGLCQFPRIARMVPAHWSPHIRQVFRLRPRGDRPPRPDTVCQPRGILLQKAEGWHTSYC